MAIRKPNPTMTNSSIPEKMDSKFRYVLVAARRAEQLMQGARSYIDSASAKPSRVAQEEVRMGVVPWRYEEEEKQPLGEATELLSEAAEQAAALKASGEEQRAEEARAAAEGEAEEGAEEGAEKEAAEEEVH